MAVQYFVGIDPGTGRGTRAGGWAVVSDDGTTRSLIAAGDVPVTLDKTLDSRALVRSVLMTCGPSNTRVGIEAQSVRPGDKIRSVHAERLLNQQAGALLAAFEVLHYDAAYIPQHIWKRNSGLGQPKRRLKLSVYRKMLLQRVHQLYRVRSHVTLLGPRGGILDGRCTAAVIAIPENWRDI